MSFIKQDDFSEILSKIDNLIKNKDRVLVAIDGMSASGKTSLAKHLQDIYDCNVFHMDDFFLTEDLRSQDRLNEIGGNVDYIRFDKEVIQGLISGSEFTYQVYNCQSLSMTETVKISPNKLNIIEGAYSMHPTLIDNYDLKILLKIDPKMQSQRILDRNGETMHDKFINLWIPKENKYLDTFSIEEESDLVIKV